MSKKTLKAIADVENLTLKAFRNFVYVLQIDVNNLSKAFSILKVALSGSRLGLSLDTVETVMILHLSVIYLFKAKLEMPNPALEMIIFTVFGTKKRIGTLSSSTVISPTSIGMQACSEFSQATHKRSPKTLDTIMKLSSFFTCLFSS